MVSQQKLQPYLNNCLSETNFNGLGQLYRGKVRDNYSLDDGRRVIISTDRQSAFDFQFEPVPLKGQALNLLSAWWFGQTKDIIPNHLIKILDPNVSLVKEYKKLPVEVVIRGYITGVTGTSMWKSYESGQRVFCGHTMPAGLVKNQKLPKSIITPSTKPETGHDKSIAEAEVVSLGLTTKDKWEKIRDITYKLFAFGSQLAEERGLILVDTKYEFGEDEAGELYLIDEIHTADSSRFWDRATYEANFPQGQEPEYFDKEYLRLWLKKAGFEYEGKRPELSIEARLGYSQRNIELYERLTQKKFELPDPQVNILERIKLNLQKEFTNLGY